VIGPLSASLIRLDARHHPQYTYRLVSGWVEYNLTSHNHRKTLSGSKERVMYHWTFIDVGV